MLSFLRAFMKPMRNLFLFALLFAAALAVPFAAHQWRLQQERQRNYEREVASEAAPNKPDFDADFNQAWAALKGARDADDFRAEEHAESAVRAARAEDRLTYEQEMSFLEKYLPKSSPASSSSN
jgi:hypothetical protein